MKKAVYLIAAAALSFGCKSSQNLESQATPTVVVSMDLVNIEQDKVKVSVDPGRFTDPQTIFYIPKTVPGTYSLDNYGEFIEELKAFDYEGQELQVTQNDENSWRIDNATSLDKITYLVNDSFDVEGEKGVFSPAGTNIEKEENFMLNLHGFIGYFDNLKEQPYKLIITRPRALIAGTAMPLTSTEQVKDQPSSLSDSYDANRYFDIIDNPIMYAKPDTTHINVEGIRVLLSVYSPNGVYNSASIKPGIEKMIAGQKRFLGEIDNTSSYAILLYLADPEALDAKGYGALEHHTSTVVVLPESMPLESLITNMTDIVSHEFFHIITPLSIHSEEIHYFDYNEPEMSQHLWLYEGVTEYFANLFQVNQGLIDHDAFYSRISSKIETSKNFNDSIPFTLLSERILEEPYKSDYYNVYLKGALIGMALDIRLRELSQGEVGILDLMKKLSERYGKEKPFKDEELIPVIVEMTYPEIADFFSTYVSGGTPIPYEEFLEKVGVQMEETRENTSYFINGQIPYIDGDPQSGELFFRENISLNSFLEELGVQNGDIIKSVNGTPYDIQNVYELVMNSQSWQEGEAISIAVLRDDKEIALTGKISQPTDIKMRLKEEALAPGDSKAELREAWLKK